MIVTIATVAFDETRTEEMMVAARRAEEVFRALPGCHSYNLTVPLDDRGRLHATEVWTDLKSFLHHIEVSDTDPTLEVWRSLLRGADADVYDATQLDIDLPG